MIHNEDCLDTMRRLPTASVDLIMTSPPYAGKRSDQYPVPTVDGYLGWFLPIAAELRRILKPSGSFILNIKEGTTDGERQVYVMELVLALRLQGWRWVDDYIWHKSNPVPGRWLDRLKDGWEHCHHFTAARGFKFNGDAVRVELSDSSKMDQLQRKNRSNKRYNSRGSGFGYKRDQIMDCSTALPSNVLYSTTAVSHKKGHPAAFPPALPEFFIKLLSDPGDLVYDPFAGSGTTLAAAKSLGRRWVGSEISPRYVEMARERMGLPSPPDGRGVLA